MGGRRAPAEPLPPTPYAGINAWLLGSLGYAQNYFLTWRQIKTVGASVKKGESYEFDNSVDYIKG